MGDSAAVVKVCVICGQDVADRPRTKDSRGHYYCKECYRAAAAQAPATATGAYVPPALHAQKLPRPDTAAATTAVRAAEDRRFTPAKHTFADILGTSIYGSIAAILLIVLLSVWADPTEVWQGRIGSAVVLVPLAACVGLAAHRCWMVRATIHDLVSKPVLVLLCCGGLLVTVGLVTEGMDREASISQKKAAELNTDVDTQQLIRDKAEHMRERGMDGTDEDLARTYDRAESIDSSRRARERRLGN
jgi:hypothetical protein